MAIHPDVERKRNGRRVQAEDVEIEESKQPISEQERLEINERWAGIKEKAWQIAKKFGVRRLLEFFRLVEKEEEEILNETKPEQAEEVAPDKARDNVIDLQERIARKEITNEELDTQILPAETETGEPTEIRSLDRNIERLAAEEELKGNVIDLQQRIAQRDEEPTGFVPPPSSFYVERTAREKERNIVSPKKTFEQFVRRKESSSEHREQPYVPEPNLSLIVQGKKITLLEPIGKGGIAEVWAVSDAEGNQYALKITSAEGDSDRNKTIIAGTYQEIFIQDILSQGTLLENYAPHDTERQAILKRTEDRIKEVGQPLDTIILRYLDKAAEAQDEQLLSLVIREYEHKVHPQVLKDYFMAKKGQTRSADRAMPLTYGSQVVQNQEGKPKFTQVFELMENIVAENENRREEDKIKSLFGIMREKTPRKLSQKLLIARKISIALARIHQRGFAHLDIKPANIMVDPARKYPGLENPQIAVTFFDFNTSELMQGHALSESDSESAAFTPRYASPEKINKFLPFEKQLRPQEAIDNKKQDIYSLGVTLYAMFFGLDDFHNRGAITLDPDNTEDAEWVVSHNTVLENTGEIEINTQETEDAKEEAEAKRQLKILFQSMIGPQHARPDIMQVAGGLNHIIKSFLDPARKRARELRKMQQKKEASTELGEQPPANK
ncbi:MAG: hypothetical protein WC752_02195 [Patescibacteria group bacterium]|jgi:serine/threonine protein kinase